MEQHLTRATEARSHMKGQVVATKEALREKFPDQVAPVHSSPSACSRDMTVHYSFDFAQQVCNTYLQ